MLSDRDVRARLRSECDAVGLRQWCRRHGCDPSYVSKVLSGDKGIGESVCRALNLTPVIVYQKLRAADGETGNVSETRDIVERLRDIGHHIEMVIVEGANKQTLTLLYEAADEIERLRAENAELRQSVDILTKQCGEM